MTDTFLLPKGAMAYEVGDKVILSINPVRAREGDENLKTGCVERVIWNETRRGERYPTYRITVRGRNRTFERWHDWLLPIPKTMMVPTGRRALDLG